VKEAIMQANRYEPIHKALKSIHDNPGATQDGGIVIRDHNGDLFAVLRTDPDRPIVSLPHFSGGEFSGAVLLEGHRVPEIVCLDSEGRANWWDPLDDGFLGPIETLPGQDQAILRSSALEWDDERPTCFPAIAHPPLRPSLCPTVQLQVAEVLALAIRTPREDEVDEDSSDLRMFPSARPGPVVLGYGIRRNPDGGVFGHWFYQDAGLGDELPDGPWIPVDRRAFGVFGILHEEELDWGGDFVSYADLDEYGEE
jgi:hypothetical protein